MKKKIISLLLILAMTCAVFAGCSKGSGDGEKDNQESSNGTTEITIWTTYGTDRMSLLNEVTKKYNDSQDKYHVSVEYGGSAIQVRQKMATSKPEVYPSIFFGTNNAIYEYATADYVVPIQQFIDADSDKWTDDMYENVKLSYSDKEGTMIGSPIGVSVKGYFVNLNLLQSAGYTVEDITSFEKVAEISRTAHDKGLCKYGYVVNAGTDILNMLTYQGVDTVDAGNGYEGTVTKCMYTEGETNASLKKLVSIMADMYTDGVAYPNSDGVGGGSTLFVNREVVFWSCQSSNYENICDMDLGFDYTFIPMTGVDDNAKYKNCALTEGTGMFITNTGDEAEMQGAYEFIKYLSQPENQYEWCADIGYIPYTKEAENYEEWTTWRDENFPVLKDLVEKMQAAPSDLKFPYTRVMSQVVSGNWDIISSITTNAGGDLDSYIENTTKDINQSIEMLSLRDKVK